MQINISQKKEEPLLSRTMLNATLEFDNATPSYPEITALIASNIKSDEKLIAIRHVYSAFGAKKAEIEAYVYKDEKNKKMIEPKSKKEGAKPAEGAETKPEEAAKEAPKSKEKKESKKDEDPKAEDKPKPAKKKEEPKNTEEKK